MTDRLRRNPSLRIAPLLAATTLLAVACSEGPSESDPDFSLEVQDAVQVMFLGTSADFVVNVQSTDFEGPVSLEVGAVPVGWTVELEPAQLHLERGENATVVGSITVDSDAVAPDEEHPVVITGNGEPGERSATLTVALVNRFILFIDAGTGAGDHWGDLTGGILRLRQGATLEVRNLDATPHNVHTSDVIDGLSHQESSMGAGESYLAVIGGAGTDEHIYCHDHGTDPAGEFTITVE